MVLGQKLGFDHSFLFASHPLLSNTSVAQPMCKENKGGLFARMHPTNCHKVETASQRRRKGTNACFLRPFQATYLRTISIFTPDSGCPHLSDTFFTFQIHKASQPTHPPAWFSVRVTNVEQNESTAHMLQSQPPQAQVADALSMLESVTESNIPTSCSNCRPRRTKSTTYNYYKGEEGEG